MFFEMSRSFAKNWNGKEKNDGKRANIKEKIISRKQNNMVQI